MDPVETRNRLIEAAGEVFAEQGFHHATVRDICQRAGANVAAVNYHFGSKEKLYEEVLNFVHACSFHRPENQPDAGLPPDQRLRQFVRGFLLGILDAATPQWQGRLIAREIADPSAALDLLVEQHIRPRSALLRSIIRDILGPAASDQDVWFCAFSVVSQLLFYHHSRPVLQRLYPGLKVDLSSLDLITDHVWRFCLDAIEARAARGKGHQP